MIMKFLVWLEFIIVVIPATLFLLFTFPSVVIFSFEVEVELAAIMLALWSLGVWGVSALWKMFFAIKLKLEPLLKPPIKGLIAGSTACLTVFIYGGSFKVGSEVSLSYLLSRSDTYQMLILLLPVIVGVRWFLYLKGAGLFLSSEAPNKAI